MTCSECGGGGTLFVLQGYVDQQAPLPADTTTLDPVALARLLARRAALANTVYPCPECRPEMFAAWSKGEFAVAPLGTRATVPAKARGGRSRQEPLPIEPHDLHPDDDLANWSMTRRDLQ